MERSVSVKRDDPERDYEQRRRSTEKKLGENEGGAGSGDQRGDAYGTSNGEQLGEAEKRAATEAEGAAGRE